MTQEEWSTWCVKDALKDVSKGLLIYVVLLGTYWLTIG